MFIIILAAALVVFLAGDLQRSSVFFLPLLGLAESASPQKECSARGRISKKIKEWYLKPKFFEKNGKLYEFLRVKKYQELYGEWYRFAFGEQIPSDMRLGFSKSNREKRLHETEELELPHVIESSIITFFSAFIILIPAFFHRFQSSFGLVCFLFCTIQMVNILRNIYPIMSQRYLRIRILEILEHKSRKNEIRLDHNRDSGRRDFKNGAAAVPSVLSRIREFAAFLFLSVLAGGAFILYLVNPWHWRTGQKK